MKIKSFHIEIQDGKVLFKSTDHRKLFDRYIEQFPDGKYTLDIEPEKKSRTSQQNNYYWFYLGLISEDTGYTTDELHTLFKGMFLSKEIKEVMGKPVRLTKSTTDLSVGEFCDYLASIALETEIQLPDTSDFYGYSYHK